MLARLPVDRFVLSLVATVTLASLLPAHDAGSRVLGHLCTAAVAVLFFLYGSRLSPREARDGARHWRLHLLVLAATFVLFPVLGLLCMPLRGPVLGSELYAGLLFLCVLPSTVQSSIAFVSVARGNVAAAVCAATFSNLLGVLLTPLLVMALVHGDNISIGGDTLVDIGLQLLVPFLLGQLLRPWCGAWTRRHRGPLHLVDRGAILLVVYAAFSDGVTAGIWGRLPLWRLAVLVAVCCLVLTVTLLVTNTVASRFGFDRADRVTVVFCGSKKSLASGLPMAAVLFAGHDVALVTMPLMLFHQIQLMVCSVLAPRWARTAPAAKDGTPDSEPPPARLSTAPAAPGAAAPTRT